MQEEGKKAELAAGTLYEAWASGGGTIWGVGVRRGRYMELGRLSGALHGVRASSGSTARSVGWRRGHYAECVRAEDRDRVPPYLTLVVKRECAVKKVLLLG